MSVVSSVLSTRSSGWRINVRLSALMDSIFAIGFGLGLRFVVDTVSRHDFKLTGSLVGLWEGVIMLHFTKKMPKSSDPYIGYGVRLFIDFMFTESIPRLALVLICTALGMVLADTIPAIWVDVGLARVWRHFRRDLYTMTQRIPTVVFFPPARTVRFSPSREPSVITDEPIEEPSVISPSIITPEQTPTTNIDPTPTTAPRETQTLKRRVPGYFPEDYTDTETELGSVRGIGTSGRTSRRLSVFPQRLDDSESEASYDQNEDDLDENNLSSGSLSDTTERGEPSSVEPSSAAIDITQIPEMVASEEDLLVDTAAAPVKPEEGELTPKQRPTYMPPTPSDSAAHWRFNRNIDEPVPVRPLSESLPQIPDFLEEPTSEDWEKIQPQDYDEKPPTPPAKDRPSGPKVPIITAPVVPAGKQTPSPDDDMHGWDTLDSQFISRPAGDEDTTTAADNTQRESQPPPYDNNETNYDDIYDDPPASHYTNPADTTTNIFGTNYNVPPDATVPTTHAEQGVPDLWKVPSVNAEAEQLEAQRRQEEEEAARLWEEEERRKAEEEAARLREEEEQRKKQEAEAEAKRREEEEEKARVKEEKKKLKEEKKKKDAEERARKEAEDEALRQKRREADEAAEKLKQEVAAAEALREAEKKKQQEAEGELKKFAAEAKARREEAEMKRLKEQNDKEDEEKRQEKEARKKEEEAKEALRLEEEAKEAKRLKDVAEEAKREEAAAAKKAKRLEEEAEETKRKEDEEKEKQKEELDRKQREEEEEAEQRRQEEKRKEEQEKQKKLQEEEEARVSPTVEEVSQEPTNQHSQEDSSKNLRPADPSSPVEPGPREPEPEPVKTESVISEASNIPPKVSDRLGRLLLLRAQMIAMEGNIEDLKERLEGEDGDNKAKTEEELRSSEKALKKMQKKESRRHDQAPKHTLLDGLNDTADSISLEGLGPREAEYKIEEKVEELMAPGSNSLYLTVKAAKGKPGGKQMTNVNEVFDRYGLFNYTHNDKGNGRILVIEISEPDFAEWLHTYRMAVTQNEVED